MTECLCTNFSFTNTPNKLYYTLEVVLASMFLSITTPKPLVISEMAQNNKPIQYNGWNDVSVFLVSEDISEDT